MSESLARHLLDVLAIYVAIGTIVALPLIVFGLGRIDPATHKAPWTFRLLVLPGLIAMWPLFARRLIEAGRPR